MPVIEKNLPRLVTSFSSAGLGDAARAIMTTDTFPKAVITRGRVNGREIMMAGMAKGAGMINPQMATLLSFVFTDARISPGALRQSLRGGVKSSFNRITVDGDTSTNDTLLVLANGLAGNREILNDTPGYKKFSGLLHELLFSLARMIARDGEGATKLVEIVVDRSAHDLRSRAGGPGGGLLSPGQNRLFRRRCQLGQDSMRCRLLRRCHRPG